MAGIGTGSHLARPGWAHVRARAAPVPCAACVMCAARAARAARAGGRFDGTLGQLPLHFDPATLRFRDLAPHELATLEAAAAAAADRRGGSDRSRGR